MKTYEDETYRSPEELEKLGYSRLEVAKQDIIDFIKARSGHTRFELLVDHSHQSPGKQQSEEIEREVVQVWMKEL